MLTSFLRGNSSIPVCALIRIIPLCLCLLLFTFCEVEKKSKQTYRYHIKGNVEDTCNMEGELYVHIRDLVPGDEEYNPIAQVTKLGKPGPFSMLYTSGNSNISRLEVTCKFKDTVTYKAEIFRELYNLDYLEFKTAKDGNPVFELGTITFDCD